MRRFPRNTLVIVLLAVLWLLAGAWLASRSVDVLLQGAAQDERDDEVVETLLKLYSAMQDAETGQRGYILTHRKEFLEPYDQANRRIDKLLTRTRGLTLDDPEQRRNLEQLRKEIFAKRQFLAMTIESETAGRHEEASSAVAGGAGRTMMSDVHASVEAMQQEEARGLALSSRLQRSAVVRMQQVIYAYAVLSLLLLTLSIVVVNRELRSSRRAGMEILTANRQLEQQIREMSQLRDTAMAADRAKTAFLATVSHELRTPLNAIIGFSGLMLDGSDANLEATQRKHMEIINKSGRHLLGLVSEVIDITVIEGGRLELDLAPVDLREILDEQCDALRISARSRNLELAVVPGGGPIVVLADAQRLRQVVSNLLSNAIKFTDQGYVHVTAAVEGNLARVVVDDTGIGIPTERRAELFVPFRRIRERDAAHREGLGLGLSICKRLIEHMGGSIGIDDNPRGGSRFWFTLPLARISPPGSA